MVWMVGAWVAHGAGGAGVVSATDCGRAMCGTGSTEAICSTREARGVRCAGACAVCEGRSAMGVESIGSARVVGCVAGGKCATR
jgi:hypothetical protein